MLLVRKEAYELSMSHVVELANIYERLLKRPGNLEKKDLLLIFIKQCGSLYFREFPNLVYHHEHGVQEREQMIEKLPEID